MNALNKSDDKRFDSKIRDNESFLLLVNVILSDYVGQNWSNRQPIQVWKIPFIRHACSTCVVESNIFEEHEKLDTTSTLFPFGSLPIKPQH